MSVSVSDRESKNVELRIIVERVPAGGRWAAWFQHNPGGAIQGDEAMTAFDSLLNAHREALPDPYQIRVDDRRSRGGHIEVLLVGKPRRRATCPACKGSGKYVGLNVVESCSSCRGTGTVATADAAPAAVKAN
jgi:hypothetical protein